MSQHSKNHTSHNDKYEQKSKEKIEAEKKRAVKHPKTRRKKTAIACNHCRRMKIGYVTNILFI